MDLETEYISAACNCTYNCLEVTDSFILYGTNKALAIYDLNVRNKIKDKNNKNLIN